MVRDALFVTALMPEASPLIATWGLKPARGEPLDEILGTNIHPKQAAKTALNTLQSTLRGATLPWATIPPNITASLL